MDSKSFVTALASENQKILDRLRAQPLIALNSNDDSMAIPPLLKMALKNELEATELAAMWLPSTPEMEIKMGFARQVGDESKHYRLIEDRLGQLGISLEGFEPLEGGYSALFQYLIGLKTSVERLAAGQFTREAVALVKNQQFIELCESRGDVETARLYREIIQPDERYHYELGRKYLEKYTTTVEAQRSAREASRRTLELAEELQGIVFQKMGVHHAPGC